MGSDPVFENNLNREARELMKSQSIRVSPACLHFLEIFIIK